MVEREADPRRRKFSTLNLEEQTCCRIQAQLHAQGLDDRGFHSSYLLLIAEAIMDLVEAKRMR
jgi:hypothetical protein